MCSLRGINLNDGIVLDRVKDSYTTDIEVNNEPESFQIIKGNGSITCSHKDNSSYTSNIPSESSPRSQLRSSRLSQDSEISVRPSRGGKRKRILDIETSSSSSSLAQPTLIDYKVLPDCHPALSSITDDRLVAMLRLYEPREESGYEKPVTDSKKSMLRKKELMTSRYAPEPLSRPYSDIWAETKFLDRWHQHSSQLMDECDVAGDEGGSKVFNEIKLVRKWNDLVTLESLPQSLCPNFDARQSVAAPASIPVATHHPAAWSRQSRADLFKETSHSSSCKIFESVHPAFTLPSSSNDSFRMNSRRPYFYHTGFSDILSSCNNTKSAPMPSEPTTPLDIPHESCRSPRTLTDSLPSSPRQSSLSQLNDMNRDIKEKSAHTNIELNYDDDRAKSIIEDTSTVETEENTDEDVLELLLESQRELQAIEAYNYLTLNRLDMIVRRQTALETLRTTRCRLDGLCANVFKVISRPNMRTKLHSGLGHFAESNVRRNSSGTEFPQMGALWNTETKEADFIVSLRQGSVAEAYVNNQWIIVRAKRLFYQASGKSLRYVKVTPLGSFAGDALWLAVEDGCLVRPGTHITRPFYDALGIDAGNMFLTPISTDAYANLSSIAERGLTKQSVTESSSPQIKETIPDMNASEITTNQEVSSESKEQPNSPVVMESTLLQTGAVLSFDVNENKFVEIKEEAEHEAIVQRDMPESLQESVDISSEMLQIYDLTSTTTDIAESSFVGINTMSNCLNGSCEKKLKRSPQSLPKLDESGLEAFQFKSPDLHGCFERKCL